jgi:hypothetical protein
MKRSIVMTTVLCLAVAVLGFWAVPALAADGCTCHTAVPPTGGAPAAHDPLVAGVPDCTTCHVAWTVPHPEAVSPKVTLAAWPYVDLDGQLKKSGGNGGYDGVTVYLQQRAPSASGFTDLMAVKTHRAVGYLFTFHGVFGGTVASPVWGATYRAVSQGVVGPPVVKPGLSPEVLLTPGFAKLQFRNLNKDGTLRLGRTFRATGRVKPGALLAGEKLVFSLYKMTSMGWKVKQVAERAVKSDGTFSCQFRPTKRGTWEVYLRLPATAQHNESIRGYPHHIGVK